MLTMQNRMRTLALLLATAGAPALMAGCLGASDDKQGSGVLGTGGPKSDEGREINTSTQAARNDKGEPSTPGTLRQAVDGKPDTGGLGAGSHNIPGKPEPTNKVETETPK